MWKGESSHIKIVSLNTTLWLVGLALNPSSSCISQKACFFSHEVWKGESSHIKIVSLNTTLWLVGLTLNPSSFCISKACFLSLSVKRWKLSYQNCQSKHHIMAGNTKSLLFSYFTKHFFFFSWIARRECSTSRIKIVQSVHDFRLILWPSHAWWWWSCKIERQKILWHKKLWLLGLSSTCNYVDIFRWRVKTMAMST